MSENNVVIERAPGWYLTQTGVSSKPEDGMRFRDAAEAAEFLKTWPVKCPDARFVSIEVKQDLGRFAGAVRTDYNPFGFPND